MMNDNPGQLKMRFSGRKVVVTGASRGIGLAIAEAFRSEGATVIGTATTERKGDAVCQEWIKADFSRIEEIESCAARLRQAAPDILINNAGINRVTPFTEIALEDFVLIQRVNVVAPFALCQAVVPAMLKTGWGRIVNISSIWGKISREGRASYSASKFAIDGLTASLSAEHAAAGVLSNCVAPGFVDTELTRSVLGEEGIKKVIAGVPARRLGKPEEIARLVLWLSSDENTFVTGQNIAVDGGFTRV
jgi:NAD(P)-dependent dehydrogenase (short-subunit alcohol dehydrogenase family)